MLTDSAADPAAGPRWQPLAALDRRVLGVLLEKAKTTPDAYPLSLNAVTTGCNQKNNRYPLMQVESDEVEQALDRLRAVGAAAIVQGIGRVSKYRHYFYEWLGVDKVEAAVMAELLLRGAQTEGELRGRAARMEPIADVAALRPILESLQGKGLVVTLSSESRGRVVTHALYQPAEMEKLRRQQPSGDGHGAPLRSPEGAASDFAPRPAAPAASRASSPVSPPAPLAADHDALLDALRRQVEELRAAVGELRTDLAELRQLVADQAHDVRGLRDALGG